MIAPESKLLLAKAERSITAAKVLANVGDGEFAVSRIYYAMFYTAEALLIQQGLRFHKHSALHSAFGEHFAKTGRLDPKFHRWMLDAFDKRLDDDYGTGAAIDAEEIEIMVAQAQEFLEEAWRSIEM